MLIGLNNLLDLFKRINIERNFKFGSEELLLRGWLGLMSSAKGHRRHIHLLVYFLHLWARSMERNIFYVIFNLFFSTEFMRPRPFSIFTAIQTLNLDSAMSFRLRVEDLLI